MRRAAAALAVAAVAVVGISSCKESSVKPEPLNDNYYPVEVGTFWRYQVVKTRWQNNKPTATQSELGERVADKYTDAAGKVTYRIIRSHRANATAAWIEDSVMSVTVLPKTVEQTRSNRRTVELIYPVRAGAVWNRNAYNDLDTVVAQNRRYENVGAAFTVGTKQYTQTITTFDEDENNIFYVNTQKRVFAQGVGPIYRERRRLFYCQDPSQNCQVGAKYITSGEELVETLIP